MIQLQFGFFCGSCSHFRPGSTMHECNADKYFSTLVLPDTPIDGCKHFRMAKHAKTYVVDHGLIVEKGFEK